MKRKKASTRDQLKKLYDALETPLLRRAFYDKCHLSSQTLEKCLRVLPWLEEIYEDQPHGRARQMLKRVEGVPFSVPKGFNFLTSAFCEKVRAKVEANPGRGHKWFVLHMRGTSIEFHQTFNALLKAGLILSDQDGHTRRFYPKTEIWEQKLGIKKALEKNLVYDAVGVTLTTAHRYFKHLMQHHREDVEILAEKLAWLFEGDRIDYNEFARLASRKLYYLSKENGWRRQKRGGWVRDYPLMEEQYQ